MYDEFICKACSEVCFFLKLYPEDIWAAGKQTDPTIQKEKAVLEDMSSTRRPEKPNCDSSYESPKIDEVQATVDSESTSLGKSLSQGENTSGSIVPNQCPKNADLHDNCLLGVNIVDASPVLSNKPMFLSKNWRAALCKCNNCLEFYNQKHIAFLVDKEDSIAEYEQMAKQKREEKLQQQEGAELSFFNKLGHVEKVEILKGIEEMKDGLRAFLVCLLIQLRFLISCLFACSVTDSECWKGKPSSIYRQNVTGAWTCLVVLRLTILYAVTGIC